MSDADDKFVHTTDSLLALYRSVERSTLDLPVVSFMPMLIFIWAALRFDFFLVIGLVLIIPVNLVILIRNIFPGHWRYRPFFLSHLTTCGYGYGAAKFLPSRLYFFAHYSRSSLKRILKLDFRGGPTS